MGASGKPTGVTALDGYESEDVPASVVATTVNVYATPFVRPGKVGRKEERIKE
jgi:hypothetical protein